MGSSKNSNALQKERQAELKKKFFKTMGDLCVQLLGENVLHLLPPDQRERVYLFRMRDYKFIFQHNNIADKAAVADARQLANDIFYRFPALYGPTQCKLTPNQTDNHLFLFCKYLNTLTSESFKNAALFIEKTKPLHQIIFPDEHHFKFMMNTQTVTSNYFHDLSQYYVRGTFILETLPAPNEIHAMRIAYTFEWFKAPSRRFNIEGNTRPANQLLHIFNQPTLPPLTVTPAQLGINSPFAHIPLNIYMQQHAISRLHERLDVLPPFFINIILISSLIELETCLDSHGNRLVVVKYQKVKLGYLRVDLVEGCVLIRTFLLFTQDSTPEGEKIKQLSGFQKEDISYLHLDKISSFINLDFSENSRLKKMLQQCGLTEFIENQKSIKAFVHNNRNQYASQLVEKYLTENSSTIVESECM